jgi:hypothetical protein
MQMLETVSGHVGRLGGGGNKLAVLQDIATSAGELRRHMTEHLQEEEDIGLPLLRHNFSDAETKPVIAKIVESLKPADMAWFLRQFETVEEKRAAMRDEAGVPAPVISLIMMPAVVKYHNECVIPLQTLIAGATQAPPRGGGCTIL